MRSFLKKILDEKLLTNVGRTLDLGCGNGADAQELAALGYTVDVVEKDTAHKKTLAALSQKTSVVSHTVAIENFKIQKGTYTLIIANNSLPFVSDKERVTRVITDSVAGLTPKGVLYFTLFGPRDAWAAKPTMSFFSYDEALSLLETLPVQIYHRATEEGYGKTMKGDIKYWHIHRFFCIKK